MRLSAAHALVIILSTSAFSCTRDSALEDENLPAVEIVAKGLSFTAPDTIPSGWTRIRFRNETEMTHFALIERLPEGVGIDQQQREVAAVFQKGEDRLRAGDDSGANAKFGELPKWYGEVVFSGGPGLLDGGKTSEIVIYLDPGIYLIECYVKTEGTFHSYNPAPGAHGMARQLVVTSVVSETIEPIATANVTISSERGIEVAGLLEPGRQTVSVRFENQKKYENFMGHDVHLVRLENDTDLQALASWMDWRQPIGLETPAPAVAFLGGVEEMPAGKTAYFIVNLEPGRYAWISEVPNAAEMNMLKVFTVGDDPAAGG